MGAWEYHFQMPAITATTAYLVGVRVRARATVRARVRVTVRGRVRVTVRGRVRVTVWGRDRGDAYLMARGILISRSISRLRSTRSGSPGSPGNGWRGGVGVGVGVGVGCPARRCGSGARP